MYATKPLPRGIRNKNAGNIRRGEDWEGLSRTQADSAFCQFDDPVYGLRALMKVLLAYRRKHSIRTIGGAISRWAPPSENDTLSYISTVSRRCGIPADSPCDWTEPRLLIALARAIVTHENGRAPQDFPADWYSPEQYRQAAMMALGLVEV